MVPTTTSVCVLPWTWQSPPIRLQRSMALTSSAWRSPPTVSISTSCTSFTVTSPPTLCRARTTGACATERSPPRLVNSIAAPLFSKSASPPISRKATSPDAFSNSTCPIPSTSTSPCTFMARSAASRGMVNFRLPWQSISVGVLPSCCIPAALLSISTRMACSRHVRTCKSPCTCVMTTRGFRSTLNVCLVIICSFIYTLQQRSRLVRPLPGLAGLANGQLRHLPWPAINLLKRSHLPEEPGVLPAANQRAANGRAGLHLLFADYLPAWSRAHVHCEFSLVLRFPSAPNPAYPATAPLAPPLPCLSRPVVGYGCAHLVCSSLRPFHQAHGI